MIKEPKTADEILESLINDVLDKTKANGPVAVAHAHYAEAYFKAKEKAHAVQEQSAGSEVSRTRLPKKDEPADLSGMDKGDTKRTETTRSRSALLPSKNA